MDDHDRALLRQVHELVERERVLRRQLADPLDQDRLSDRAEVKALEEELDQCWDLLRQRSARRAVHQDPQDAHVRPVEQLENYLPRQGGRL